MSEIRRITITGGAHVLTGADTGAAATMTRRNRTKKAVQPLMRVVVEEKVQTQAPQAAQVQQPPLKGGSVVTPTITPQSIKTIQITTETHTQQPSNIPAFVSPSSTGTIEDPALAGKVILGGKKPKHFKVLLTKKNHDVATLNQRPSDVGIVSRNRKVTLGLQHLKRRVTKARRLQKITKTAPIEQIRKELIAAKIIKEDSKAPDTILRQMYSDAKLVTTKSL